MPTKKQHNHKRLMADVRALIDDLETARSLLSATYAQYVRGAKLSQQLLDDVAMFLRRSERTGGES